MDKKSKAATEKSVSPEPRIPEQPQAGFPIVGIGASAGGLGALEALLKNIPPDAGLALVVVMHLDPNHVSYLPDILQRATSMPVEQVARSVPARPNHVFVIPPNKNLTINEGQLHLLPQQRNAVAPLPIDTFFCALAKDQGEQAYGIILSGTGSDGTLGIKAIKSELGMVMVQDEASAKHAGMPHSAIATGLVDFILPPEKMPAQLLAYQQHGQRNLIDEEVTAKEQLSRALQKIFGILRTRTGHDFSQYKQNTIRRRIQRRMTVHQIDSMDEYIKYIEASDHEADILFKEMLIGVTSFFRDEDAFDYLSQNVLPKLLAEKTDDDPFRVWVPGCATGEEAYSIAILLHECMGRMGSFFPVQIFGTDIDEAAIDSARAGVFSASIVAPIQKERLARYFKQQEDGRFQVKKLIREMLVFAVQNVAQDPPFTRLDMLCCRNLLIYLDAKLQQRILPVFHYSLRPGGILFLGTSETIGSGVAHFSVVDKKWKIYRRKSTVALSSPIMNFPKPSIQTGGLDMARQPDPQKEELQDALLVVENILQQSDTPPCAVVNESGHVIYIHGRTGRYLEPAEGRARMNLLDMARPGLRSVLTRALREAATGRQKVVCRGLTLESDGASVGLDLTIKPFQGQASMRGLFMVEFEPASLKSQAAEGAAKKTSSPRKKRTVEQLEQELHKSRENLQTTIEELEASCEELKSTNEELQSTNEELQSTNEELETSKEELQSLNEESSVVNTELQTRIDELSKANDDMKNLMDSTDIATVFVDTELCIRRFTSKATEIIPLTAADVGRPIDNLATSLVDVDLKQLGQTVLQDMSFHEAVVDSKNGRHYSMRLRPYRTASNVIEGVVYIFDDITDSLLAQKNLAESQERYRMLFEMADGSLVLIDKETGSIIEANRQAFESLGYTREEFMKLTIMDIENPEDGQATMNHLARGGKVARHTFRTRHRTKDGEMVEVQVKAQPIELRGTVYILSTWRDLEQGAG